MEGAPYKRAILGRIGQSPTGLRTFPGIAYSLAARTMAGPFGPEAQFQEPVFAF